MRRLALLALLLSVGCSGVQHSQPPQPSGRSPVRLEGPTAEEEGDLRGQALAPAIRGREERQASAPPPSPAPHRPRLSARIRRSSEIRASRPHGRAREDLPAKRAPSIPRPTGSSGGPPSPAAAEVGASARGGETPPPDLPRGFPAIGIFDPPSETPEPASPAQSLAPEPSSSLPPTEPPPASGSSPPVLTPPRPLLRTYPAYPGTFELSIRRSELTSEAALRLPEGRARLRLLVRADGTVGSVEVLVSSGVPELDRAAQEALRTWRFEPARQDGTPIPSYYVVWVTFQVEP